MWILVLSLLGEEVRDREGSNFPWKWRIPLKQSICKLSKHQEDQGRDFLLSQTEQRVPSSPHMWPSFLKDPSRQSHGRPPQKAELSSQLKACNALLNSGTCLQASPVLAMNKVLLGFCRGQELGSCFNRHEENNRIWQTRSSKCLGFTSVYNLMCLRIFVQIHVIFH